MDSLKKINKYITSYSDWMKKIIVTSVAIIILPEIEPIKIFLIHLLEFLNENNMLFGMTVLMFAKMYTIFRFLCLIILLCCILLTTVFIVFRPILEKAARKKNLNSFEASLRDYLENKKGVFSQKSYLITGEWGSGKTHLLNDFLENNLLFSKRPIYKVSCFGLDTRQQVISEIVAQIEEKDNSFINWIQYVPLIGTPIFSLLKKTYSLQNISSNAIFIFDDFERITPLGITSETSAGYYRNTEVARSSFDLRRSNIREFKEINDEFEKIQKGFRKIQIDQQNESTIKQLQKYNVVTGLINELVENNGSSVIIICNTDVIGNNYMDKIFRGKLDCITYRKVPNGEVLKNIYEDCLQNQVFQRKETTELLSSLSRKLVTDFQVVWQHQRTINLRSVKSVFQAYFDTVSLVECEMNLTEINLLSLFYCIYLVEFSRNRKELNKYEEFAVGGNLKFFLSLYRKQEEISLLSNSEYFDDIQWVGISLAGYWLLNFGAPENLSELIFNFEKYPYHLEEKTMDELVLSYPGEFNYSMDHFLFFFSKESDLNSRVRNGKEIDENLKNLFISLLPKESENQYIYVKELLERLSMIKNVNSNFDYLKEWFSFINEITGIRFFETDGFNIIFDNYNNRFNNQGE
ncbi:ATP-binding protein [Enterococcus asini]|uniref:ATP-binding protein n=1 Tax=Enterococcus asini TaxID=57732 RepID=UPI0022E52C9B|nr:ATP-binding protein [Enterococcus asini]